MSTTATRERPIIFSAPMVKAILDGRKTQTRRVVKHQGQLDFLGSLGDDKKDPANWGWRRDGNGSDEFCSLVKTPGLDYWARCPYGKSGDKLWVKEAVAGNPHNIMTPTHYFATDGELSVEQRHDAGLLKLNIKAVRVERLQDISVKRRLRRGRADLRRLPQTRRTRSCRGTRNCGTPSTATARGARTPGYG